MVDQSSRMTLLIDRSVDDGKKHNLFGWIVEGGLLTISGVVVPFIVMGKRVVHNLKSQNSGMCNDYTDEALDD